MALSFHASLIGSSRGVHLYRVVLDGERVSHLILREVGQEILSASASGEPDGGMRMTLQDGNVESPAEEEGREEFALVSTHIRSQWLKTGTPPTEVRKFFG
jgi:hypothetical protein